MVLAVISCGRSHNTHHAVAQRTFASPEDAGAALFAAARSADRRQLIAVFGPESGGALFTGDNATDNARLAEFAASYSRMHRWTKIKAGGEALVVGADNVVFPIPVGMNPSGRYYFDTPAGRDEILARRIGKNERTAMLAAGALATAEQQFHQQTKQFARKFVSDPGRQNGLYWPAAAGEPQSPLGRLGDFGTRQATAGSGSDAEFNGYRYRILDRGLTRAGVRDYVVDGKMTGGFAILAYPADYRVSGITSFLVGEDGGLYRKDLGEHTAGLGATLAEYNPADGWTPAATPPPSASRMR
jgi:hypothetical protein